MATRWYIDTTASPDQVVRAFNDVFLTRPGLGERAKFWSKKAQLRSNLRWQSAREPDAVAAAELVSGGLREAAQSSKYGGGSIVGTTVALAVANGGGTTEAQLWLANYNTFFGVNQQGDIIRVYTKQIADRLRVEGCDARVHK